MLQAFSSAAFPPDNFAILSRPIHLAGIFGKLIRTLALVLQWPESTVDPARLHPLAQRMVDAGQLPCIEGQSRNEGWHALVGTGQSNSYLPLLTDRQLSPLSLPLLRTGALPAAAAVAGV